uniref:Ig-like domain-containing protein n=1 Tax=Salmo trutta TaxID=8032 RepID=A0A674C993_SALTR
MLVLCCAGRAKAVLTIHPKSSQIFSGESVTFRCNIQRGKVTDWEYTWRKDDVDSISRKHEYEISEVNISDNGDYRCLGTHIDQKKHSKSSDAVSLTVTERPVAVLTLQPNWPQIFRGETVTLRCDIQGGEEIEYAFYNSGKSVYTKTEPEYRISPAMNGLYTCEGLQKRNGLKHSQTSNAIQLTVLDKPQAVLSVSPQWLNPGDSVTLSCGVKETSTGWRFFWSYSVEPLSGSGTSEDSYTLIPAGPSHTGGYVCRAGRGDPVYDTLYSEPQFFWSGVITPHVQYYLYIMLHRWHSDPGEPCLSHN